VFFTGAAREVDHIMAKSLDRETTKKEMKKATKSLKEKRADKKAKKETKKIVVQ
jgi:hypothetical protein